MKLLDSINHSWYDMFVSFSEALQASSEATLTRSAIPGSAWVIEPLPKAPTSGHMPYHKWVTSGHFARYSK